MYSVCLSLNKSSLYVFVKRDVSVCLSKNGSLSRNGSSLYVCIIMRVVCVKMGVV